MVAARRADEGAAGPKAITVGIRSSHDRGLWEELTEEQVELAADYFICEEVDPQHPASERLSIGGQ